MLQHHTQLQAPHAPLIRESGFKFPPLPHTLFEVLKVLSQKGPVPSNERLVEIIQRDPATAAYVLRRVNSAYYGLRRKISQVERAVTLLGFKEICNMVLAAGLMQSFAYLEESEEVTIYQHVMKTSVATAVFARALSRHLTVPYAEVAFTAGLLHQLGRLVILYSAPKVYVSLWFGSNGRATVWEVPSPAREEVIFGDGYPQIGAEISEEWGLPDELITVLRHHLVPERILTTELRPLAQAVALASLTAEALYLQKPEEDPVEAAGSEQAVRMAAFATTCRTDMVCLAALLDAHRDEALSFAESLFRE